MDSTLSKAEREALKTIYRQTHAHGADARIGGAQTGDLAEALGVTPGTMTTMLKRLDERGFAVHRPYRGVELTKEGRQLAVSIIRRHRIVERFLADMLGYEWNEADRLAPAFEHALPQEVEERMYAAMDRPLTCPHGFPIPESEMSDVPELPSLYSLEPGEGAVVAMSGSMDSDVIAFLDTLGLRPGVSVEVREKHPFDGPMVLRVDGEDRTVGDKIARQIYVSRDVETPTDRKRDRRKEESA